MRALRRFALGLLLAPAYLAAALPPCGFDEPMQRALRAERLAAERVREEPSAAGSHAERDGAGIAKPCACGCDQHADDVTSARLGPFTPARAVAPRLLPPGLPRSEPPSGEGQVALSPPDRVPIAS